MEEKKQSSLINKAAVMAVIILLAKMLGLLRDVLVANLYGTTASAVAYETASRLPTLIFDFVLGGVVSAAFIPVFSDLLVKEGKKSAMRFAASYANLIFCLTGAITLIGVIFASPLVTLLAPELPAETHALAVSLTQILFPMVICTGLAYSFVGILQSMGEFNIPALISLVSNSIMVAYLVFLGDRFGVMGLAIAMLCGWAAQIIVQIPKLRTFGFRPSLSAGIMSPHIKRSLKMALPILIGTWTQPLCSLINTRFASAMEEGRAITALGYANRLYTILVGVFSFVATNLLFPYFSRAAASGDMKKARSLMMQSLQALSFIIAPMAVGIALLAEPAIALIYERGSFTAADTALTAGALRFYAVGMLFAAANEVLSKSFFAENQPRLPMISSICAMVANIALVMWLSDYGVGGIALASGIAAGVQCALNVCFMLRRTGGAAMRPAALDLAKSVLAAAIMGGVLLLVLPHLPEGNLLRCVCAVAIGAAVYALSAIVLRSEEADFLLQKLRRTKKGNGKTI